MLEKIENFLYEFFKKYNFSGAVLGVSGGVDSAVVLGLLVRVLDKEKIKCFILPERDSPKKAINDAKLVCRHFNVDYEVKNVTKIIRVFGVYRYYPPAFFVPFKIKESFAKKRWNRYKDNSFEYDVLGVDDEEFLKGISYYRIKHRVRMVYLYKEAEKRNFAVVGTTNKTEFLTGLYVKWGDDSTDVEPLLHLYKTQVFELAKVLSIPEKILNKPASPDLIPGLNDEDIFGLDYPTLDRILKKLEENIPIDDEDPNTVEKVRKLYNLGKIRNQIRNISIE
ncbi:NAD synthetase [Thermosipho melanesiensis]|uniref:NH(3)-dependent NAD(+) synthetase n=2 Tax=Thermosipho melanesiensis TaxID=46541 RepID=A6LJ62_THEM4|nr:NAD(+) synthase [Thermosipho melanesiensis]ABR29963.1 NAD+ synthetase [Thermosipho melanesiensis BI429]APT73167.1 NAD synthetase [Thermosipho melanesiensis]OOC38564.1 NAD synthetase [Thermosipho melanesiensis]OOC40368.1 NAD synthetase [Thermosipho melanesiensis]OOC40632.1 NAD synthetase [Thermosipho melanesiensis]